MSLRDEVIQATNNKATVEKVMAELDPEDAEDLAELLVDVDVEASAIARVLRKRGFEISDRSVQRYRATRREALDG